ncbi:MAG: STAS domain-containing protein [Planctomycetota bacterium]|jgi:anti-anti-sigma factor|nr:STAS domain-containing protein [Planctomycetota bacterium]
MADLRIISQPLNDFSWITTVTGRMDSANFNVVEDEFNRLLESRARAVAVDLSGLENISSSGMGAFINMANILRERGGKLAVFALSEDLIGLAEMLGVRDAIVVVANQDEANRELAAIQQI